MIPKELQSKLRDIYSPDGSVLRDAQIRMLKLLTFLDRVCKKHNLTYWLDGGTLLGAMRHGGFIPWDDDTDVCMPRKDALKLKSILKDNVHEGHIILHDRSTDTHYKNSSWMTLRDLKSRYIQDSYAHNRQKYQGLQVDIFMMEDNVPTPIKRLSGLMQAVFISHPLDNKHHLKFLRPIVDINHSLLDTIVYPVLRLIKNKRNTISYGLGTSFYQQFDSTDIFPCSNIRFEGIEFNCPKNPESYLKTLYGDWTKIPEENEIQIHTDTIELLPL